MNRLDEVPIACGLTSAELRERAVTLLAQFRSAVMEMEELQDGYSFGVPGDSESIALLAKMIIAERECCPFLTFEFIAQPNRGPVIIRMTGPTGAKEFLRTVLCNDDATN